MRRVLVAAATALALSVPASVASIAFVGSSSPAFASSSLTCARVKGKFSGSMTIEKCSVPSADKKTYKIRVNGGFLADQWRDLHMVQQWRHYESRFGEHLCSWEGPLQHVRDGRRHHGDRHRRNVHGHSSGRFLLGRCLRQQERPEHESRQEDDRQHLI